MTDYSCSLHHLGHARVPGTVKGCFIGRLLIKSLRPDRNSLDHKAVQRNRGECTITIRTKWAVPSTSLELLGESLKEPWGCTQWEGSVRLKPSPLGHPFPSRHLSRLSPKEGAASSRGKEKGRLAGLVLLSFCSQEAAKKGTRKLSYTGHIYWCCSSASWTVIHQKQHWNWHSSQKRKGSTPKHWMSGNFCDTGWRNTCCCCSSKCSCSEDNREAAWLVHTFH